MKRAIVIAAYESQEELDAFLAKANPNVRVSAVYGELDATDAEHVEDVIEHDFEKTKKIEQGKTLLYFYYYLSYLKDSSGMEKVMIFPL